MIDVFKVTKEENDNAQKENNIMQETYSKQNIIIYDIMQILRGFINQGKCALRQITAHLVLTRCL